MESSVDVFIANLPRDITENALRNFFSSVGKVVKVKLMDDKKVAENKISFVGFQTIDDALEGVRIGDGSTAFGQPIKAVISKRSLEGLETSSKVLYKRSDNGDENHSTYNGRISAGRGFPLSNAKPKNNYDKNVKLLETKFKIKELIEVEIVDLPFLDFIFARSLKQTENSKIEITDLLNKVNSSSHSLVPVTNPRVGSSYLAKWDDECFYRAEILEILNDGSFRVTFVDEGTTNDIVKEIRHIPDGPLEQYPKQFTKITLGIKDDDKLKNYILDMSENKIPKIYWLGNNLNGIPIVNLFLNDEEVIDKYNGETKLKLRQNLNIKFTELPMYKSNTELYEVFVKESQFKSVKNFISQIKKAENYVLNKKVHPNILPEQGDLCIYERKTNAQMIPLRCLIRERQLFSFDVLLIDSGEFLRNVSIDSLFAPEESHLFSEPSTIICELDCCMDNDKFLNVVRDSNFHLVIKENIAANKYVVSLKVESQRKVLKYPELNLADVVGNSYQVFVSHLVSPVNFFVQINKAHYMEKLSDIHFKINANYRAARFTSIDEVEIGQAVVAPYAVNSTDEADNFRATIIDKRISTGEVHVFYVDYGNDGWVSLNKLLDVDDSLVSEPGLCINCSLNVRINTDAWANACKMFDTVTSFSEGGCELAMEVMKNVNNKLFVELTSHTRGVISTILISQGVCYNNKSNKSTPQKPLCNGNSETKFAKKEPGEKLFANNQPQVLDRPAIIAKIYDLENRVKQLENLVSKF